LNARRVLLCILFCGVALKAVAQDSASRGKAIVAQLGGGEFAKVEAQFDARMQAGLPADKLAAAWKAIIGRHGA